MCVQVRRNPAGLNCNQIAADPVEHRLKNGDAFELGHGVVEDESSSTRDGHGNQDRGPTGIKNLNRVENVFLNFATWIATHSARFN